MRRLFIHNFIIWCKEEEKYKGNHQTVFRNFSQKLYSFKFRIQSHTTGGYLTCKLGRNQLSTFVLYICAVHLCCKVLKSATLILFRYCMCKHKLCSVYWPFMVSLVHASFSCTIASIQLVCANYLIIVSLHIAFLQNIFNSCLKSPDIDERCAL